MVLFDNMYMYNVHMDSFKSKEGTHPEIYSRLQYNVYVLFS